MIKRKNRVSLQLKASDIASCIGKNKYKPIEDVLTDYVLLHEGDVIDHNYDIDKEELREIINDIEVEEDDRRMIGRMI